MHAVTHNRRSFFINGAPGVMPGDIPSVIVTIDPMGGFTWGELVNGRFGGATVDYSPTPEDWAKLARKMAYQLDNTDEAIAGELEYIQGMQPAEGYNHAVELLAEWIEAEKCDGCGKWGTDHNSNGQASWCDACQSDDMGHCRCGRRDCGDCGHTAAPGPY
jgi:hypothetical protein